MKKPAGGKVFTLYSYPFGKRQRSSNFYFCSSCRSSTEIFFIFTKFDGCFSDCLKFIAWYETPTSFVIEQEAEVYCFEHCNTQLMNADDLASQTHKKPRSHDLDFVQQYYLKTKKGITGEFQKTVSTAFNIIFCVFSVLIHYPH